jgi:steroid 5-alpha reductase family enzyme
MDSDYVRWLIETGLIYLHVLFVMIAMAVAKARRRSMWFGALWGILLGVFGIVLLFLFPRGDELPAKRDKPLPNPYDKYGLKRKENISIDDA